MISVNNLTYYYDGCDEAVYENASFTLDTTWKTGLIGRNGRGKTTLLKLLTGELENGGAVRSCEIIPSDRLMLETDSPYMSPVPFRGSRCDSSMTHKTAEKLAEIKGISTEEAVKMCNENAVHFFKLDIKA